MDPDKMVQAFSLTRPEPGVHSLKIRANNEDHEYELSCVQLLRLAYTALSIIWQSYQLVPLD